VSEGKFRSRRHYERTEQNRQYFRSVADTYLQFSEYAPVVALNYDPIASSKKLTADIIHFLCDVEVATKKVLKTPEALEQWKALIEGGKLSPQLSASIVNRCARIYRLKGLAPYHYFRIPGKRVQEAAAA